MASSEISAMAAIEDSFANLEDGERNRVLSWAVAKYGIVVVPPMRVGRVVDDENSGSDDETDLQPDVSDDKAPALSATKRPAAPPSKGFSHFGELFDHCGPKSAKEKFLVASYWLQVHEEKSSFNNIQVNALLREQGHALSSINRVAEQLRKERPVPLNQLSKGKSQQAKKVLKLSTAGIRVVEQLISDGPES